MKKIIYVNTIKWKKLLKNMISCSNNTKISQDILEKIFPALISMTIASTSPDSQAEKIFYQMWKTGNKNDRKTLTKMIIKLVKE